jgi:hypothetical protein
MFATIRTQEVWMADPTEARAVHDAEKAQNSLVMSFVSVRQTLGYLGYFLPVSLLLYGLSGDGRFEASISEFYYTSMGGVLTGTLTAIGVFLFSYSGYQRLPGERLSDAWLARIAGSSAVLVALLPIGRNGYPVCPIETKPACWTFGAHFHPDILHYAAAITFFACMALFCLVQFPRGERRADGRLKWTGRCVTYFACGIVILAAMVAIGVYFIADHGLKVHMVAAKYLFWFESLAVMAFATSWLVKGRGLTSLRRIVLRQRD